MGDLIEGLRSALADRYDVRREIGAGGMASVFLATDLRHERDVAIKVLLAAPSIDRGADRFRQEIRLAAGLTHPHILPVLDSGVYDADGPRFWYATPYVEGDTLRDRLGREGPLPFDEAVRIVAQIADALDYAHRQGVAHRDVKPENILLPDGQVFLADFGLALHLRHDPEARLTHKGMAVGTPGYMSPEQATGSEGVDHRTDIYSIGCVLYEALAGTPPFTGATSMAIVARVLTEPPPAVSTHRPAAAAAEPIIERALSRLPADRYQAAGDLSAALRALTTSDARRPGAGAPRPRRGPNRPTAVVALLLVAAALAFAATRMTWGTRPTAGIQEAKVAVLPFRAIGEGARETVEGITLATRDQLSVIEGVAVVGAASSAVARLGGMSGSDVAAELGTDYVLMATVEENRTTGSLEVRPTLLGVDGVRIDLWNDGPVLAPADEPGRAEATIASDVARALDLTVGAAARARLADPGRSPAAYAVYLRGLGLRGEQRRARMEEALAIDSTFALARAPLASDAMGRFMVTFAAEDSAALLEHASAAIRHAPSYAAGFLNLGLYHRSVTLDYDSALIHLDRARALSPGSADIGLYRASVLWSVGRLDEALVEARRGAGLDRLSGGATSRVSRILLWQHRLEEAWARHEEVRTLDVETLAPFVLTDGPLILAAMGQPDSARAYVAAIPSDRRRAGTIAFLNDIVWQGWLAPPDGLDEVCMDAGTEFSSGFAYVDFHRRMGCALTAWHRGDARRARATADSVLAVLEPAAARESRDRRVHQSLAYAYFLLGDDDQARSWSESALALYPEYWDFYPGAFNSVQYVQLAGLMGDADRAVDQLQRMLSGASPVTAAWLRADPSFDPIRDAPAFQALLDGREP